MIFYLELTSTLPRKKKRTAPLETRIIKCSCNRREQHFEKNKGIAANTSNTMFKLQRHKRERCCHGLTVYIKYTNAVVYSELKGARFDAKCKDIGQTVRDLIKHAGLTSTVVTPSHKVVRTCTYHVTTVLIVLLLFKYFQSGTSLNPCPPEGCSQLRPKVSGSDSLASRRFPCRCRSGARHRVAQSEACSRTSTAKQGMCK